MVVDPFPLLNTEEESPGALLGSLEEIPRETLRAFLVAVVLAQAGLFGISLGLLLVGFRGQWTIGGSLVVCGLLALGFTAMVSRWHHASN